MEKRTKYSHASPRARERAGPPEHQEWLKQNPILKARTRLRWTQRVLAARGATSEVTVRSLEQGASRSSEALDRVGKALGLEDLEKSYLRWLDRMPGAAGPTAAQA